MEFSKTNILKEYQDFDIFNKKADELMNSYSSIEEVRCAFSKNILRGYIGMGKLNDDAKMLLNSKTKYVKLSLDSFIKNKFHHRDINISEYLMIPCILANPNKLAKSKNLEDIILFKNNDKRYMLVVKTTKNKLENYIKSFRRLSDKEYNEY